MRINWCALCKKEKNLLSWLKFSQFTSVAQSYPNFCDTMGCSMPGFPVHHHLPEFTQTYVNWVGDASKPSHPLSFPSPPTINLSQHQGLFKWVSSLHQVAKVLEFQLQHQFFQYSGLISFRIDISPKKTYRWLANTWKDAQHHSLSEKCKSKPQWGTISRQSEWLWSKSLQAINSGEGVEKREPSYTVGGNAN